MSKNFPHPDAMWIWPRHTMYLQNSFAGFRYDFELETLPDTAPLCITADQSYKLHVNGIYVCRGPIRSTQDQWFFDVPDIRRFLKKGHNWLAVEAHNTGKSTYSYLHRDAAGMLCSADWDNGTKIRSNATDWVIFRNTAYNPNTSCLSGQLGFMEEVDLRCDDRSWITEEKDYNLPPVMRGMPGITKNQGSLPWSSLQERTIPMLDESCRAPEKVTASGSGVCAENPITAPGIIPNILADFKEFEAGSLQYDTVPIPSYQDGVNLCFTVPAAGSGKYRLITIDLGAESWITGVPELELGEHEEGIIIDFFYNQFMPTGKIDFSAPMSDSMMALTSRVHLNGKTRKIALYQIMGVRHVTLIVRENTSALDVKLTWRAAVYPINAEGNFHVSDEILNKIYDISVHTQRVCTMDAFVDTPWREQSQWWGDARIQAKNLIFLMGDSAMLARGIRSIAAQKNPFGLTFANAPTKESGPVLPDFCLTWVITLRDYWFQTGDTELFREQKKQAESNFAYFENIRAANGLIPYDQRFWLFEDWSTLPKRNTPTFINLWHIYAQERYLEVLAAAGFSEEAAALRNKLQAEKQLASEVFFDQEKQLFMPELDADGKLTGPPSVHDQVLALLLGLHPEATENMIQKVVRPCLLGELREGALPSSFWAAYLLDCAIQYGLKKEAVDYIRRSWEPMIPAGTVWENFPESEERTLSCAHAWSAHTVSHLPELFFGLEQTGIRWNSIKLEPMFLLDEVSMTVPLPQGMLTGKIRRTGNDAEVELDIPQNINAEIRFPGETLTNISGKIRKIISSVY